MKISIVIPVYNDKHYLGACLEALENQTVKPFEVIVVDNNSPDGSIEIAKKYTFVTVIHEPRQGIVFARDAGFNEASGDILARIDSDSILPPDWVEKVGKAFSERTNMMAFTGAPDFYDAPMSGMLNICQVFIYQRLQRLITGTYMLWGANMALRREAWVCAKEHVSSRVDLDEDIDLSLCMHDLGHEIHFDSGLKVKASAMRGRYGLIKTASYLSSWPKDYFHHKMYFRGLLVAILSAIFVVFTSPLLLINDFINLKDHLISSHRDQS